MTQWLRKKIISFMGNVYVWLDKGLKHETENILDVRIDEDFRNMSRYELCNHIEKKFEWEKDSFWNLESTQKIRLCCQMARDMERKHEKIIRVLANTYGSQAIDENQNYSDIFKESNRGKGEEE